VWLIDSQRSPIVQGTLH